VSEPGAVREERGRIALFAHLDSAVEAVRIIERHGRLAALVVGANRLDCLSGELAGLAGKLGVPILVQSHSSAPEYSDFESCFRALGPDLLVSFSHAMLLHPGILTASRLGGMNLHNGLLPEYRGANVLNWAVVNGETHAGVTLHWMDQGLDTGPVIAAAQTPITREDTALTVRDRLVGLGWKLLDRHLPDVLAGNAPGIQQDESRARVWPRRTPDDGRIDWSCPAVRIHDLIRALVPPWPGAWYLDREGRRTVIDRWISLEEVERLKAEFERHALKP